MDQPTEVKTIKFDEKNSEGLIGLSILGAKRSVAPKGYRIVITKADGKWLTGEDWERKGKYVCVHVENEQIVAVEDNSGNVLEYRAGNTAVQKSTDNGSSTPAEGQGSEGQADGSPVQTEPSGDQ